MKQMQLSLLYPFLLALSLDVLISRCSGTKFYQILKSVYYCRQLSVKLSKGAIKREALRGKGHKRVRSKSQNCHIHHKFETPISSTRYQTTINRILVCASLSLYHQKGLRQQPIQALRTPNHGTKSRTQRSPAWRLMLSTMAISNGIADCKWPQKEISVVSIGSFARPKQILEPIISAPCGLGPRCVWTYRAMTKNGPIWPRPVTTPDNNGVLKVKEMELGS